MSSSPWSFSTVEREKMLCFALANISPSKIVAGGFFFFVNTNEYSTIREVQQGGTKQAECLFETGFVP